MLRGFKFGLVLPFLPNCILHFYLGRSIFFVVNSYASYKHGGGDSDSWTVMVVVVTRQQWQRLVCHKDDDRCFAMSWLWLYTTGKTVDNIWKARYVSRWSSNMGNLQLRLNCPVERGPFNWSCKSNMAAWPILGHEASFSNKCLAKFGPKGWHFWAWRVFFFFIMCQAP